jgi:MacB-like periplasmic core domain
MPACSHYLTTAFRSLRRNRLFTGLNIFGLATGLACSILIFLWVRDELSYDRFNPGAERIFRLVETVKQIPTAQVPTAFAAAITAQVAQAKNATRLYPAIRLMTIGTRKFNEKRAFFADANFLTIFNYPLVRGDKKSALALPNGVVLAEATAIKYFGSIDRAMGNAVFDETDSVMRQVTGILAGVSGNSHLQFDVLMPAVDWDRHMDQTQTWRYFDSYTYLQLADGIQTNTATVPCCRSPAQRPAQQGYHRYTRRTGSTLASAAYRHSPEVKFQERYRRSGKHQICAHFFCGGGLYSFDRVRELHEPGDRIVRHAGHGGGSQENSGRITMAADRAIYGRVTAAVVDLAGNVAAACLCRSAIFQRPCGQSDHTRPFRCGSGRQDAGLNSHYGSVGGMLSGLLYFFF